MLRKLFFILLLLPMLFWGCQKQPAPTPKATTMPWPGKMSFSTEPSQPVADKEVVLHLILTDEVGKPVSDASVNASLKMKTMDMGTNEVSLAAQGGGKYAGTGTFTMEGPWTVDVDAQVNGKSCEQSFLVVVHRE